MKKFIALTIAAVMMLTLSTAALASNHHTGMQPTPGYGYGYCAGGYNFMWDADGNRLSRDDAEARLDRYVEEGHIHESDKAYYLEMYDYCVEYGIGYPGGAYGRCGSGFANSRGAGTGGRGGCGRWR